MRNKTSIIKQIAIRTELVLSETSVSSNSSQDQITQLKFVVNGEAVRSRRKHFVCGDSTQFIKRIVLLKENYVLAILLGLPGVAAISGYLVLSFGKIRIYYTEQI